MKIHSRLLASRLYTNLALTGVAVLLGAIALSGRPLPAVESVAAAQPEAGLYNDGNEPTGMVSAAEQRKIMINELRQISARIERLETAMNKGINVRVKEMPAQADNSKNAK